MLCVHMSADVNDHGDALVYEISDGTDAQTSPVCGAVHAGRDDRL